MEYNKILNVTASLEKLSDAINETIDALHTTDNFYIKTDIINDRKSFINYSVESNKTLEKLYEFIDEIQLKYDVFNQIYNDGLKIQYNKFSKSSSELMSDRY